MFSNVFPHFATSSPFLATRFVQTEGSSIQKWISCCSISNFFFTEGSSGAIMYREMSAEHHHQQTLINYLTDYICVELWAVVRKTAATLIKTRTHADGISQVGKKGGAFHRGGKVGGGVARHKCSHKLMRQTQKEPKNVIRRKGKFKYPYHLLQRNKIILIRK